MSENEEKYRAVLEQSIDNIYIMDLDTKKLIDYNLALQVALGYSDEEMENITVYDFIAHSRESVDEKINFTLKHGAIKFGHRQYKRKDGSFIDVEVNASIIHFSGRKALCVVSRDISRRMIFEKKLLESQRQMRLFIDSSPDMYFLKDKELKYVLLNKKNCEFFGKSEKELIGKTDFDLMPKDAAEGCRKSDIAAIEKKEQIIDLEKVGGRIYETRKAPLIINGSVEGLTGIIKDVTDEKNAEEKLRQSEEKYRSIVELSPDGIVLLSLTGTILAVNKSFIELTGYKEEDFVGRHFTKIPTLQKSKLTDFLKLFKQIASGLMKSKPVEFTWLHKSGEIRTGEAIASTLKIDGGKSLIQGIVRDITEKKHKERVLKESEEKYRILTEYANDVLWRMDMNLKFTYLSPATENLFGYKQEERLKLKLEDVFALESISKIKMILKDAVEEYQKTGDKDVSRMLEVEGMHKNGSKIWIEINAKLIFEGSKITGIQGISRNITERKLYELENRKVQESLIRAEEIAAIGNWEFHFDTGTIIASRGARIIYGYPIQNNDNTIIDIQNIPLPEYRDMLDRALANLIKKGEKYDVRFKIRRKNDGKIRNIHSLAEYDKERNIVFGIIRDITEEIQREEQLIEAKEKAEQSERLKTAFLENISHEIRTPMNGILGFSALLKDTDDEEERQEYIDFIMNSGNRLLNIVNDVLDISSLDSGLKKPDIKEVNLPQLLKELHSLFKIQAGNKEIKLILFDENLDDINIKTDPEILKRALSNLIGNAVKFTHQGFVKFGCSYLGSEIEFFIEDTGIGIPEDFHENLFERFTQVETGTHVDNSGTGLGLAIAKGCAELLGGSIKMDAREEGGSIFYLRAHFEKTGSGQQKREDSKQIDVKDDFSGLNILVAEDEISNYLLLEKVLKKMNADLVRAQNGEEAVQIFKDNPKKFDLVLMDIKMPVMNGLEAVKIMKKLDKSIPVIAQTAYAMPEDRLKALEAGCDDYISKPIDLNEFLETTRSVLNKKQ